ncbi:MAG: hypothetical protein AAGF11_49815 [Myxococcota bacterium]
MLITASILPWLALAASSTVPASPSSSAPALGASDEPDPASSTSTSARVRVGVGVEGELAPAMQTEVGAVSLPLPSLALTLAFVRPFGLQLLVGGAWAATRTEEPIGSTSRQLGAHGSLRALWWPLRWERARMGLVLQAGYRGVFGGQDAEQQTLRLRRHGLAVAAGVRPELLLVPRLSVHTQLGVAYTFEDDNTTQTVQSVRLAGQVLGQAGLTIWF